MGDSHPVGGENLTAGGGVELRTPVGEPHIPSGPVQEGPSPAFVKENVEALRTMIKELDQQRKSKGKSTPKKLSYDESRSQSSGDFRRKSPPEVTSSESSDETSGADSLRNRSRLARKNRRCPFGRRSSSRSRALKQSRGRSPSRSRSTRSCSRKLSQKRQSLSSSDEQETGDGSGDLSRPYRRPKPTPFTSRIARYVHHKKAKLPQNVRVYEGSKDPEDHLSIFSAAAEQEEWPMPVWCKMFRQTLGGPARNWFNDLEPRSVNGFEELSQKFLEEFAQQKRYAKDPTEIHGIKRRPNESMQAFMDRFKTESSHIKGVPPVLRISAFMYGHGVTT